MKPITVDDLRRAFVEGITYRRWEEIDKWVYPSGFELQRYQSEAARRYPDGKEEGHGEGV